MPKKTINLSARRFGRLYVVGTEPLLRRKPNGRNQAWWDCICDCGCTKFVPASKLIGDETKSCGCLRTEKSRLRSYKHGHAAGRTATSAYSVWTSMKTRCYNPECVAYQDYGGRGITVCDRWKDSFETFLADLGEPPEGLTLDRINNDGPYSPENCRWATQAQQKRNTRRNIWVDYQGDSYVLTDLAAKFNIPKGTLWLALQRGEPMEEAIPRLIARTDTH